MLERALAGRRRWLRWSSAILAGAVLIQGGWLVGGDTLKWWREEARPLPPPDSPNVLLIVLDTVRADHLSVYGYERPTTPNLEALARRSVRFDQARAAAPWTLPSHGTLFTGRWPHELGSRWMYPIRSDVPTLAEYLGSSGYATAGFVGNTFYCGYDSGLDRGFTYYQDYQLDWLSALRTLHLVDLTLRTINSLTPALAAVIAARPRERRAPAGGPAVHRGRPERCGGHQPRVPALAGAISPVAPSVLRVLELRGCASRLTRCRTERRYRFGKAPATDVDFLFLTTGWLKSDRSKLPWPVRAMAMDAYDSCVASIDDRLGELFGELQRGGVLDRTIVIVTADHGEGFGEHDLFDHGESLYRPEIRVPLLISLPSGRASGRVVDRFVSLRDIPATIADLIGSSQEPPFPGRSLARLWQTPAPDMGLATETTRCCRN